MGNYSGIITINTLEPFQFIAGTKQTLNFEVEDEGVPIDLSNSTASVEFSPYGQHNYVVFSVPGVISSEQTNLFTAVLTSELTKTLSGKYTMQPSVVDELGVEFRPAQGLVLIIGRNATT